MLERLTKIIRDYNADDSIVLTRDTILIADLGLNSFDLVNLSCEIEDEFDVEIADRAIKEFKTIGDVIDFIENQ